MGNILTKLFQKQSYPPATQFESVFFTNLIGVKKVIELIGKLDMLRMILRDNLLACDIKWSLFIAAANSYRWAIQLKPLPRYPIMASDGEYDICRLLELIANVPPLDLVEDYMTVTDLTEEFIESLLLLHWVLVEADYPDIGHVDDNYFTNLLDQMGESVPYPCPDYVFAIRPSSEMVSVNQVGIAYYTNKLEYFHSILSNGFGHHYRDVFEPHKEPIVLQTDLKDCFTYTHLGAGWGKSRCTPWMSCIVLCEYLLDPECTEYKEKEDSLSADIEVSNGNIIQARFLLVYDRRSHPDLEESLENVSSDCASEVPQTVHDVENITWIKRKRLCLSLVVCVGAVMSFGLMHSRYGKCVQEVLLAKGNYMLGCLVQQMN